MNTSTPTPRRRRVPTKEHHPFVLALGAVLRRQQRRRGPSDTALGAHAGVATATVGNFFDGFCDSKISTVWRLCRRLRLDIVTAMRRAQQGMARRRRGARSRLIH
ncbi:MAG TPA: hypothetical protein VI454_07365 [Verrucomicrobiae bacterium]|jgi:hypothetical protein